MGQTIPCKSQRKGWTRVARGGGGREVWVAVRPAENFERVKIRKWKWQPKQVSYYWSEKAQSKDR